jgi:putative membrane protein
MRFIEYLKKLDRDTLVTLLMVPFFIVGAAGHVVDATRPLILSLSPYFLLIFGLLAVYPVIRERRRGVLVWALGTLIISFFIEAVGTATGIPFGPYTYGSTLGAHVLKVPPVIAFNWVIVILGSIVAANMVTRQPIVSSLLAGGSAVLFDYVMEPVAVSLSYWTWHAPTIPWQNYLAWFSIAALSALAFHLFKLRLQTKLPLAYVAIQLVFFLVLRFTVT